MTHPSRPPSDDSEESVILLTFAVRDLTAELARFRRFSEQSENISVPAIRYADTIHPPPTSSSTRPVSWHEKLRAKQVHLPAATIWGVVGYVVIEFGRAIADGRIHF